MDWWHNSGSPRPKKIPSAKIRWKSSRLDFLGSKRHSHWLSSKGPNYQRRVSLISAGAIEGHSEGKTLLEGHQGGLVLARQRPGSQGTCNPEETGLPGLPMSITYPIPWIWPCQTTTCSLDWKKNRGHCCCRDLVGQTTFWIFLSGLQKLEQRAKKCIELRGEYVE